jgi:ribose transport system permease protein
MSPITAQGEAGRGGATLGRRTADWLILNNFLVIFVVLLAIASVLSENFFTVSNIANLFQQAAVVGIVAVGMTYVILTANIDLSVGSMVAFGGMIVAVMMADGWDPLLSVLATLALGGALGAVMGAISAYARVPSFIITLAALVSIRGVTFLMTEGVPVGNLPEAFSAVGSAKLGDAPVMGIIFLGIALVAGLVLRYSVFGEYVYASGGNAEAARLSGVPTRPVVTAVFAVSGLLSAGAGVLLSSRLTIGQPTAAQGLELDAIAAVVLGGTSLFGGRGTIFGTVVAVMLLQVLRNVFNLVGLGSFYQMTVTGVIIVLALLINRLIDRRAGRG